MSVLDRVRSLFDPAAYGSSRASSYDPWSSMQDPWPFVNFGGRTYPLGLNQTLPGAKQEDIDGTFGGFVDQGYRGNAIVFACMDARRRLFVQARFKYRRLRAGNTGDLWGDASLGILEHPWPGATTGDLLGRALQHADMAGNGYIARRPGNRLRVMRPDWTRIILDAPAQDLDAQVMGYAYTPGGVGSGQKPVILLPEQVAHFAPIADPLASFRGISWLTPLIREVMSDTAATRHKLAFFENGATPNLVVKRPETLEKEAWQEWVRLMEAGHAGAANAYRTLYLSGGADATVVGANLQQLDFAIVQGHGETRVAAAAGVPPIIVGLSEGLQAATYSNYGQARRAFADLWARPQWQNIASSLESIVPPPTGSELWYDASGIQFLAEDERDRADIAATKAATIDKLIVTGFKADDAIKAVEADDYTLLIGNHTGLFSVQLQAPGSTKMPVGEAPGETPIEGTVPAVLKKPMPTNGTKPPMVMPGGKP
jgi:HK97 family phage portal protein